ncbi:hypothetical protein FQZ97_912310 [compost metagenome]
MLRGCRGDGQARAGHAVAFPPVQLGDALGRHAPGLQVGAHAQRRDEGHGAVFRQGVDGGVVEVVVVVVRDHDHIDLGHLAQPQGHGLEALGAEQAKRRGACAPDRVGEHAVAVHLQQHGGVAEPGGAQAAGAGASPGLARVHRRQRRTGHAAVAVGQKLAQRGPGCRRVAQAGRDGVHVAKAKARPAWRCHHAFEAGALGAFAKRVHARARW